MRFEKIFDNLSFKHIVECSLWTIMFSVSVHWVHANLHNSCKIQVISDIMFPPVKNEF